MRLPSIAALIAIAARAPTVHAAPPPAQAPLQTVVDHEDVAFTLPGRWQELRTSDGYDLRRGNEQIIVAVYPPTGGLDAAASAQKLSSAQRKALTELCKRGGRFEAVESVDVHGLAALRFRVACEEPKVAATLVAGSAQGRVITFEHYWYDASTTTPEMVRTAAAILDTVRIKPASGACPADILASAQKQDGTCLDAAVFGERVVAACVQQLDGLGWERDDGVAEAIEKRTGKKLVCYRRGNK